MFEGEDGAQVTTGTPISLDIENVDARSKDYSEIKESSDRATPTHLPGEIRPARLARSGRASARETTMRVAPVL